MLIFKVYDMTITTDISAENPQDRPVQAGTPPLPTRSHFPFSLLLE